MLLNNSFLINLVFNLSSQFLIYLVHITCLIAYYIKDHVCSCSYNVLFVRTIGTLFIWEFVLIFNIYTQVTLIGFTLHCNSFMKVVRKKRDDNNNRAKLIFLVFIIRKNNCEKRLKITSNTLDGITKFPLT